MQSNLHLLNNQTGKNSRAHIVFVDDPQQAQRFDVAEHFQTLPEFADRAFNRPRVVNEPDNGEPESKEDSDEKSSTDNDLNKKRSKTLKNDKVARRQLEKIAKARAPIDENVKLSATKVLTLQSCISVSDFAQI